MDARKADTRNKIQLGGLIVKAGRIAGIDLGAEEPAVLLGLLLETAKSLAGPSADAARKRRRDPERLPASLSAIAPP